MSDAHHLRRLEKAELTAERECRLLLSKAFRDGNVEQGIHEAREILLARLLERVNRYSALDWLFYLRIPSIRRLLLCLNDGFETAHHAEFFTSNSVKESTDSKKSRQ